MSETASQSGQETTLQNLLTAYNGESNAYVRYAAFACKADEEGNSKIAGLFRAASRAEQIHANNHAQVIQSLGGKPAVNIEPPVIKTTAENLRVALSGERYEVDTMYPGFLQEAAASKHAAALRTFGGAMAAEKEHIRLYSAVLEQLEKCSAQGCTAKASATNYYVCPVCGYTSETECDRCPVCGVPKEKFERVN